MITLTVTIYKCSYCGKEYKKLDTAILHEESCQVNTNSYASKYLKDLTPDDVPIELQKYLEVTKSFYQLFKQNLEKSGASTVKLQTASGKWVDETRLLIDKDGYSIDKLRLVFNFLQKSAFWKKNILSISNLRKHMPRLLLQINSDDTCKTSDSELKEILLRKLSKG